MPGVQTGRTTYPRLTKIISDRDGQPILAHGCKFVTSENGGWGWCMPVPIEADVEAVVKERYDRARADEYPVRMLYATCKMIALEMASCCNG